MTHLGDGGVFWILLGIILLFSKKTRPAGVAALLALLVGALITNVCLKNFVARIRPYEVVEGLRLMIERQRITLSRRGIRVLLLRQPVH